MIINNQSANAVPAWAHFFTPEEYHRFMEQVMNYFAGRQISYSVEDGAILNAGERHFGSGKMGLLNIAQFCRQHPDADWGELISRHFQGILQAAGFEQDFRARAHAFDFVKDHLAVRVYPRDYIGAIEDGLIMGRALGEDMYAMLVFDFPHSVVNVRPEQTIQWPVNNEELFEVALANVRKKYPSRISRQMLEGVQFHLVVEDHYYAPNILFDLEQMKNMKTEDGILIGIPNRHAVLIHPIKDRKVLRAIHRMIPAIWGMHSDGPGSISDKIFWLKDGKFTHLPYVIDSENILFDPPETFLNMMALLKETE